MQDLRRHEVFEMEVLDRLRSGRFLELLVFGGGTMLRLCHELPRYSVDLDFWFARKRQPAVFYKNLLNFLEGHYVVTDAQDKHFTLLYEFKSESSPRKLKIEIRKDAVKRGTELQIAYSPYAQKQVMLRAFSLEETARRKVAAALDRSEMRDFFDLEFLLRKGVKFKCLTTEAGKLLKKIGSFKKTDYSGILGSLLEKDTRTYYSEQGFIQLQRYLEKLPDSQ